jgi:hypothetical protein
MAFTFTVREWEQTRPTKAKGSGVAKGIKAVEAASKKRVSVMNKAEVDTARKAIVQLQDAFDTATGKIGSASDNKSKTAKSAISAWRKECVAYWNEVMARDYALDLESVTRTYNESYTRNRDLLNEAHAAAADVFNAMPQGGRAPTERELTNWMNIAREVEKLSTVVGISKLNGLPTDKIKLNDVPLPADVKQTRQKVKELSRWCDDAAKQIQKGARGSGPAYNPVGAIERELKIFLTEYDQIQRDMNVVIKSATRLLASTKATGKNVKAAVIAGQNDARTFGPLVKNLHDSKIALEGLNEQVAQLNSTYRSGGGDLAARAKRWRAKPGWTPAHGEVLMKRQQVAFLVIRRATGPIQSGLTEIERARLLLANSTSHRGFGAAI